MTNTPIHEAQNPEAVHGTTDAHTAKRNDAASKSKMPRTHPTLRPQNNWQERKRSGTDVPAPPVLNLP